jgi:hypothetical protein
MPNAMDPTKTALERAFEMARTGQYENFWELSRDFKKDGYDFLHIDGWQIRKQIKQQMTQAKHYRAGTA